MQSACLTQSEFFADDAHLDNLRKRNRKIFLNHRPEFVGCKEARSYHKLFQIKLVSAIYRVYATRVLLCSVLSYFNYVLFVNKVKIYIRKGVLLLKFEHLLLIKQTRPIKRN